MKPPARLPVLLAVLAVLLVLRWWVPPTDGDALAQVSEAVVRPLQRAPLLLAQGAPAASAPEASIPTPADLHAGTRQIDPEPPRDAFAVRTPPPVPPPPPAPKPVRPKAVAPVVAVQLKPPAPEVPPAPPPPPLQVIGAWSDERGASVFLAGPRGVVHSRVGDLLLAEYRLTRITPQQVLLRHVGSNHDFPLTVPAAAGSSLTPPK